MDIETVIQAGEWSSFLDFFVNRLDVVFVWFLITIIFYILGSLPLVNNNSHDGDDIRNKPASKSAYIGMIAFVSVFSFIFMLLSYERFTPHNWEEDYAIPFMESLDYSSEEVDIISIEAYSDIEYKIQYAVLENGEMVNKNVTAPISNRLKPGEAPKLRFQYLEKSLIVDEYNFPKYQKGRQNFSLLVPPDFTFYQ